MYLLGDSKSSQIDDEDKPPQWATGFINTDMFQAAVFKTAWYWYSDRLAECTLNRVKMGGGIWGRAKELHGISYLFFFSFLFFFSPTNPYIFIESLLIHGLCLVSVVGWQEGQPWL